MEPHSWLTFLSPAFPSDAMLNVMLPPVAGLIACAFAFVLTTMRRPATEPVCEDQR